jgi:hypothetical protein
MDATRLLRTSLNLLLMKCCDAPESGDGRRKTDAPSTPKVMNLMMVCPLAQSQGELASMKVSYQDLELFWVTNSPPRYLSASQPIVPVYRVGEPLQRGRRNWPTGAQYSYGHSGHELTLFYPEIDDQVIHTLRFGEAEFAATIQLPLIILSYRFGQQIPWSDVPYCWQMQPAHCRVTPPQESSPETRALLWITLVGSQDGIIHAQRGMTLAPDFTRVLNDAIRAQARLPFDPDLCMAAIGDLLVAHPGPVSRLAQAKTRTFGNR